MTRLTIRSSFLALVLFGALALSHKPAHGDPSNHRVLREEIEAEFVPTEAFFFVEIGYGEHFERLKALIVPVSGEGEQMARYVAGVEISLPSGISRLRYNLLVMGEAGEFSLSSMKEIRVAENAPPPSLDELSKRVREAEEHLSSWRAQYDAQEASLRRLEADAAVLRRAERVEEMEGMVEAVRQELENVEKERERVSYFLTALKNEHPPRNFARREITLTKQLEELARASKESEGERFARKTRAEQELQAKIRLAEEARTVDIEHLRRRLKELREYRERLDQRSEGTAPALDSNEYPP